MKKCSRCKVVKKLELFSKDNSRKFGVNSFCKICDSLVNKEWRKKNGEKYRLKQAKNAKKFPEKTKARNLVAFHLRKGNIIKKPCEVMGCEETVVHAHHQDYSKPLEVIWLCIKHHNQIHKGSITLSKLDTIINFKE